MKIEESREIVINAVETTRPTWESYDEHWRCIDKVFLVRAYEQGGFEAWKFCKPMHMNSIFSIEKIGTILDKYNGITKYQREFAGSLENPFYIDLKKGKYGKEGQMFYKSVKEFKGNAGQSFYRLLWWMLICCNYLKTNYNSSFSYYIKKKYAEFARIKSISDEEFKKISIDNWEEFKTEKQPWNELYGIGPNVFDFIIGDVGELKFLKDSYKFDTANKHFLEITGIYKGELTRENIMAFFKDFNLPYSLREINTAIFLYCSEANKKDCGFCRDPKKCQDCNVNNICEKNF